ncbi:Lead, cadmium, zinc and mercury transporting ATPase; Copper-translocating P-type ATPase [hydrothermal vent metagenome]|uniref:Lead, cadmium, zinc and mercury transporting ATPase Copper-translocating P-type ATPase n=1 Tax=hydrothermal vent metagenome TaxID=652676 RepID=A0A3B1D0N4_9ZZZZ
MTNASEQLKTFSQNGLTQNEVKELLNQYGYNELKEKKINPLIKFSTYLWGPIPWMIEVAAVLSALVKDWIDFGIIMVLLLANAVVGFWEEHQAGNAIEALKAKLAIQCKVKRDGKWMVIPARELVPGDIIRLRLGDIVPADVKLLEGDSLNVDQSALTGESLPVTRKVGEEIYSGSIIKQGEMDSLVYATGEKTFIGKTAHLVNSVKQESHFQKAVLQIGDYLIVLAIALVVLILGVAFFRHDDFITTLKFALVLTVAAIPVAMPTVLSVTMAVGAKLLATKQAIVSRLAAIEELAGMDMLCSDKTGTLTQNKLTLGEPFSMKGVTAEEVILSAAIASRIENQDAIDMAILNGLNKNQDLNNYHISHFQPFDPVHKRTEATVKDNKGREFKTTKGAPQVILAMVENKNMIQNDVEAKINEFAARGFRSLGVARTDKHGQWQFLGVIPLYDPPREDTRRTIAAAKEMGIKVKMITGDQVAIARETAKQVGLGTNILDSGMIDNMSVTNRNDVCRNITQVDGFAQVFPEHKYHIVDMLQQCGHITGMTGDGVNDAPALKKGDVGIAVSGATDAARAAADIVLLSPGLSVIIDSIKESRKIFQRMNSYVIYRIAETIRVLFFMTLSILVFNFYPVTAVMIVLLALLNDGAILSIAYDRAEPSAEPDKWNMKIVLGVATLLGVMGVVESFGLFYIGEHVFQLNREVIQTLIYLKLSVSGHLTIFVARTKGPFWSSRPSKSLFWAVIGTQLIATFIAVNGVFMAPLGWGWALFVWGYALIAFFVEDLVKLAGYKIFDAKLPGLLKIRWNHNS